MLVVTRRSARPGSSDDDLRRLRLFDSGAREVLLRMRRTYRRGSTDAGRAAPVAGTPYLYVQTAPLWEPIK